MGRWTQYDEDDYRLPEGMKRIGYDSDTGRYIFRDTDGSIWQGAQGATYSEMTKISDGPATSGGQEDDAQDDLEMSPSRGDGYHALPTDPNLPMAYSKPPDRNAYRTLFPFFLGIGVILLVVWRFIFWPSITSGGPDPCPEGAVDYMIQPGDSCWAISNAHGTTVDALKQLNPKVVCERLLPGQMICVPSASSS